MPNESPPPQPTPGQVLELAHPPLLLPFSGRAHWSSGDDVHILSHACHRLSTYAERDTSVKWVLNHLRVECENKKGRLPPWVSEAAILHQRQPANMHYEPKKTVEKLHLHSTYSLLSHILPQRASLLCGRSVIELGAGLGALSSVLQQVQPPLSRLVVTDGDESLVPLLRANVSANHKQGKQGKEAQVMMLKWNAGQGLLVDKQTLVGGFDLVIAADCIFSLAPPVPVKKDEGGAEDAADGPAAVADRGAGENVGDGDKSPALSITGLQKQLRFGKFFASETPEQKQAKQVQNLLVSAAALLNPGAIDPPARLIVTTRPPWESTPPSPNGSPKHSPRKRRSHEGSNTSPPGGKPNGGAAESPSWGGGPDGGANGGARPPSVALPTSPSSGGTASQGSCRSSSMPSVTSSHGSWSPSQGRNPWTSPASREVYISRRQLEEEEARARLPSTRLEQASGLVASSASRRPSPLSRSPRCALSRDLHPWSCQLALPTSPAN